MSVYFNLLAYKNLLENVYKNRFLFLILDM